MKPSEMASLSNSRLKYRNPVHNKGDIAERAKHPARECVCDI